MPDALPVLALCLALCTPLRLDAGHQRQPIGKSGHLHSPLKRQCRWWQQSLKQLGLLEKVEGARGLWRLTEAGRARVKTGK